MSSTATQLLPLVGAASIAVGATVVLVVRRSAAPRRDARRSASIARDVLLGISVVAVVVVTLMPSPGVASSRELVNLVPLRTISSLVGESVDAAVPLRNVVLNVLLFVPFGFLVGLRTRADRRVAVACAAGVALSLVIEGVQWLALPGRAVDVDDVLLNTVGAVSGALVAALASRAPRRG
ncbi:MAG TPA: VanZ family protein [Actinomycetota bacterium]|nr:VanZ family protein [Actinomycetota bacterium]